MAPFDRKEQRILARLSTPIKIQQYLDNEISYDKEPNGPRCRSARLVLRDRVAHCMEGALFAAAALAFHGHPPLLVDLEAYRDDDHVLAVFKDRGRWGSIAKSNYSGLRFREPVYRSIRELVMTYFDCYFNLRREKSLRAYSRPVNLSRFDHLNWATSVEDVWFVPEHLCEIKHYNLLDPGRDRTLSLVDVRLFNAGKYGRVE